MSLLEGIYTGALHGVRMALPLLARGDGKLARGIRGRRGALARLEAWGREMRDRSRPLIWFHAPSVGEGLQARAVMEEVRRVLPEAQLVYTHFSPSAEALARSVPADVADYLPLDLPSFVSRLFDALTPSAVAFSKTEIWPNLTREAERRGVPVVLLSATLPESSSRLGPLARALLAPAHRRLTLVAAISHADAERFASLSVPSERTRVMGDARFDQVWNRVRRPGPGERIAEALRDPSRLTLVAGSTWPPDEDRLVDAWARLQQHAESNTHGAGPRPRLIIVPHEPTPAHLERLGRTLSEHGLAWATLTRWLSKRERQPAGIAGTTAAPGATEVPSGGIPGIPADEIEQDRPSAAAQEPSGREAPADRGIPGDQPVPSPEAAPQGGTGVSGEVFRRGPQAAEDRPVGDASPEVVVVDRVGILGDLYRIADVAYVGGGFGRDGLHSVLEPAAFGVPVVFGPRYDNSREAAELIAAGGAASVAGTDELTATLERWLAPDPAARNAAGSIAREYVEGNLGAARAGARIIADLIRSPHPAAAPVHPGSDPPPP